MLHFLGYKGQSYIADVSSWDSILYVTGWGHTCPDTCSEILLYLNLHFTWILAVRPDLIVPETSCAGLRQTDTNMIFPRRTGILTCHA